MSVISKWNHCLELLIILCDRCSPALFDSILLSEKLPHIFTDIVGLVEFLDTEYSNFPQLWSMFSLLKETDASAKCMDDNNYNKDMCTDYFLKYKSCRKFWVSTVDSLNSTPCFALSTSDTLLSELFRLSWCWLLLFLRWLTGLGSLCMCCWKT